MRLFKSLCMGLVFACSISCSSSSPPAVAQVRHVEVLPLFNRRIKASAVAQGDRLRLNPAVIATPGDAIVGDADTSLRVRSLGGDVIFKDILLQSDANLGEIEIAVEPIAGIAITPRLVTSWFQAGITTRKNKRGGALTYELLLTDDRSDPAPGRWRKSDKGGWIYYPPEIRVGEMLYTRLAPDAPRRVLLRFEVPAGLTGNTYRSRLVIRKRGAGIVGSIPLQVEVSPVELTGSLDERYTLALYTALRINEAQDRPGAYVNAMRLPGDQRQRESLLQAYLEDIRRHGFNGITIRDWDSANLGATLDMARDLGYRDVILHATSPTKRTRSNDRFPIVNEGVVEQFISRDLAPMFYGFDEVGGNKKLPEQLALNRKIHRLGGESVNAVFWDDLPQAKSGIARDTSRCFDVIAHSLGSHGHVRMLGALPFRKDESSCPGTDTRHVVYWHPHVENPTINRLFMGYWLWASGFDGVIPHGHYFPSHIEKVLSQEDRRRGMSSAASPYDDWSFWLPRDTLRHHNAVYPSTDGPVGTLQWEGVLDGHTDLKYIVSLEELFDRGGLPAAARSRIQSLLEEIRVEVLKIRSPYLDNNQSLAYLAKMERWRAAIADLLRRYGAPAGG